MRGGTDIEARALRSALHAAVDQKHAKRWASTTKAIEWMADQIEDGHRPAPGASIARAGKLGTVVQRGLPRDSRDERDAHDRVALWRAIRDAVEAERKVDPDLACEIFFAAFAGPRTQDKKTGRVTRQPEVDAALAKQLGMSEQVVRNLLKRLRRRLTASLKQWQRCNGCGRSCIPIDGECSLCWTHEAADGA